MAVTSADAGTFGKVETHGIDAIPAIERHGRPRGLAFLWAGAFANYASLFTASLLTTYYGLGVWDGLVATVLGTVSAALILGLLSNTGPRSGLPQIIFTRGIFGRRGSYIGAALTLFLAVGWFAVDCVIAAQAGAQLFGGGNRVITFGLVILVAAISVAVAVYGHRTITVLATYGSVIFVALAAAMFLLLAPQFHWAQGPSVSGADYPGAFVLGFMTCFALVASWYPFASDYSRYLPESSPARSVTLWPIVGVALPMALLGLFGLLLPTIDARLAADQGVLAVISAHAPAWVAIPFFVFVMVGEIWANYFDVYTAGLVTLTMGIRMARWRTALGCGVIGTALAAYAVLVSDLHVAYEDFLILTYLWAPAWAAVVLLSFFIFDGKARPRLAIGAWLAGTAVSLLFVNYDNLFSNVTASPHFFNDALVRALHGADVSGLVSMAVAAALYWGARLVRAK
ncbi:MAG TPA: cytosine permease [Candidatus Dormibacteraeota bacterium]|jgi:NCS1 family nucleobase:cation symporter-1|nr:cytosine permease [Candidatus Dormibacteraeota bacterium]